MRYLLHDFKIVTKINSLSKVIIILHEYNKPNRSYYSIQFFLIKQQDRMRGNSTYTNGVR